MTELLAVFRSRSQAVDCNSKLRVNGIPSVLVNTPKEAHIGCGLSVKIPVASATRAKYIIRKCNYSAFYGFLSLPR